MEIVPEDPPRRTSEELESLLEERSLSFGMSNSSLGNSLSRISLSRVSESLGSSQPRVSEKAMFTDLNSSSKSLKIRSKYASEIPE
jgi:hypothetical protein